MIIVTLDLIILIVGLLMYALSTNGKLQEIGRIMFAFGLLAFLLGGDRLLTLVR